MFPLKEESGPKGGGGVTSPPISLSQKIITKQRAYIIARSSKNCSESVSVHLDFKWGMH